MHAPLGLSGDSYEEARWQLVLDKLSKSTQATFNNQFKWWQLFCKIRGEDLVLKTALPSNASSAQDRIDAENLVLDYIIHSGLVLHKAPGTVTIRLAAIRSYHLNLGLQDPFLLMPRVPMAMAGLKRRAGKQERRHPVTTRMLRWVKKHLPIFENEEAAVIWAALCIGFFFLLRASEYLDVGRNVPNRGLNNCHVVLKRLGEPCDRTNFEKADEVAICIQGSKTDIFNRGQNRNHFINLDEDPESRLCVVEAIVNLCKFRPDCLFKPVFKDDPLLLDCNRRQITRNTIQSILRTAAQGTGSESKDFGSHSLRFGGASALWAAYHDSGLVRRWGRWATDSFHTYIWEDRKGAEGISSTMAKSDVAPT